MSATEKLGRQWDEFRQYPSGQRSTPRKASGKCASASHDFTNFLRQSGHPQHEAGYLEGYRLHVFEGHPNTPTGHIAPVLNGQVVDWTARQLDPSLGHPHVEDFETYRLRFESDHPYLHPPGDPIPGHCKYCEGATRRQ